MIKEKTKENTEIINYAYRELFRTMFCPYKQSLKNLGIPTSIRHQKHHFLNMFMYVIYKYTIMGKWVGDKKIKYHNKWVMI